MPGSEMFGQFNTQVRVKSSPYKLSAAGHIVTQIISGSYDHLAGTNGHNGIHNGIPVDVSPQRLP